MNNSNEKQEEVVFTRELDVDQKKTGVNWRKTITISLTILIIAAITIVIVYAIGIAKNNT